MHAVTACIQREYDSMYKSQTRQNASTKNENWTQSPNPNQETICNWCKRKGISVFFSGHVSGYTNHILGQATCSVVDDQHKMDTMLLFLLFCGLFSEFWVFFCLIDLHFFFLSLVCFFLFYIFLVFLLRGVVCERGNMKPVGGEIVRNLRELVGKI